MQASRVNAQVHKNVHRRSNKVTSTTPGLLDHGCFLGLAELSPIQQPRPWPAAHVQARRVGGQGADRWSSATGESNDDYERLQRGPSPA